MRKALLLALAMVLLIAPIIDWAYLAFAAMTVAIACILWIYLEAVKHLRRQEPEVDENQLACELSEFMRFISVEDGK